MPVTMICPNLKCRRTVNAPDQTRGRVVRCPHCQQPFMVPDRAPARVIPPTEDTGDGGKKKGSK